MARPRLVARTARRPKRFARLDAGANRRARRLGSLALAIAELAALVALLLTPTFTVRSIVITGNTRLTDAQIVAAAGLGDPGSVFLVDPGTIERRLVRLTWVRAAAVTAQLPDRVSIRLDEWQPVAIYRAGAGPLYLLSDQAVALGVAASSDVTALLEIDGPAEQRLKAGRAALDRRLLTALVNIQRALPGLVGQEVQSFTIDVCGNLTLNAKRGWKAQFGRMLTPEEFASLKDKVASLKALAAAGDVNFDSADLQYVNVMNPTLPAVKDRDKPVRPGRGASPSPASALRLSPSPQTRACG
jgi:cell division septal protein FtsQ